ncbi:MAG: hypothetical protein QF566_02685, partial [Candidatus Thalassarchaeaceae archaeon]|nr:hypothetical protein [Candidatus Thalassarchaeaceae archaeon]
MTRTTQFPMLIMVFLMVAAPMSGCIAIFKPDSSDSNNEGWVDPVMEIEDENHSHSDLFSHRLSTSNTKLIDYHN